MDEQIFHNHPELEPFVLFNVQPTGIVIGSGAYGSVEKVVVSGTTFAAKRIHDILMDHDQNLQAPPKAYDLNVERFIEFLDEGIKTYRNGLISEAHNSPKNKSKIE